MKKFLSLFLTLAMLCAMVPAAYASTIYTAKEMKVKHDFQAEGVEDGEGTATYVDVEGGYYISPWKYEVENISLTVTYKGEDYKVKTEELDLDGLKDVKVSVFERDGKVETSTESAPDDAEKIAKFKVDLETWTVIAMPKTGDLEMAVKFQYKDAKPDGAKSVDAFPLDKAAQAQAQAPAGSVQLIQDFKECKGVTDETKEIRTVLKPDENGIYFASRWDYKLATKEGEGGVGPNIDCKVVYNGSNKKMKGEDIKPDANNCGTMFFFEKDGKLDVAAGSPFAKAIDWAVAEGITTGKTETTFGPSETCTVSHILTFLWRASGKPGAAEGVKDRDAAAKWAVEQELIAGDEDVNAFCTRMMAVSYLWKVAGKAEAEAEVSFTDVDKEAEYLPAIAWAVEKEITSGTGDGTTFEPEKTCTRGQIVTFLYRAAYAPAPLEASK